jgi:hypothetical protein
MVLPGGDAAERVYPPLVFLVSWGRALLDMLKAAAGRGVGDVSIIDVETATGAEVQRIRAG